MGKDKQEDVTPQIGRAARFCTECGWRRFGEPRAVCPSHPGKTINQPDVPYRGSKIR